MTSRVAVSQPGVLVRLSLRIRMSPAPVLTSARAEGCFESRWQCWSGKVGLLSLQVVEHAFGVGRSGMAAIRVSLCWAALAMLKLGAKFGNGVHTSPSAQGLLPEVKGRSRSQDNCWSGLINRILVVAGCGGVFLLPKIDIF